LEKCSTFLILTADKFTKGDQDLVKKVMKVDSNKKVFLIRTKIDQDYQEESQKEKFNEKDFRTDIKDKCFEKVKGLQDGNEFFIITESVDDDLKIALLNALKSPQKECLTLLLGLISKRMLGEKADLLRGNYTVKLNLEKH
jgi:tRNA U34 5-carboxymethylaminomethyl modifying GTPase MnmE/TrmE